MHQAKFGGFSKAVDVIRPLFRANYFRDLVSLPISLAGTNTRRKQYEQISHNHTAAVKMTLAREEY